MKKLIGLTLLMLLSNAHAEKLRITGIDSPVEFTNGYNLEHCLELDGGSDRVRKMGSEKCGSLRSYSEKENAKKAAEKAEMDSIRENWDKNDYENCVYGNGHPMGDINCKVLRKRHESELKEQQKAEDNRKWREERRLEQERLEAQKIQDRKDADARFFAKQAAEKAASEAEAARWEREDRAEEKKRNDKIAAMKARCGSDYKNPTIGMKIERVKDCVAPAKMVSQVNRADGVVSIFQYGSQWFNVMEGRVVAWGKY